MSAPRAGPAAAKRFYAEMAFYRMRERCRPVQRSTAAIRILVVRISLVVMSK